MHEIHYIELISYIDCTYMYKAAAAHNAALLLYTCVYNSTLYSYVIQMCMYVSSYIHMPHKKLGLVSWHFDVVATCSMHLDFPDAEQKQ